MSTSALCVVASWASFVIPPGDANARVAIFITMILVLVTIFNAVMEKTPVASGGTTAIVIWMLSMFMFVFVAFLGYCVALLVEKRRAVVRGRIAIKMAKIKSGEYIFQNKSYEEKKTHRSGEEKPHTKYFRTHQWDLISLLILFASFIIYVSAYAIHYTTVIPYSNQ